MKTAKWRQGFYLFTPRVQPVVVFHEDLLGEWEVFEWDRKTPIAKVPE